MPEYKWTLKNKKYCTGCPVNHIDYTAMLGIGVNDIHFCSSGFYEQTPTVHGVRKKRPAACVRELGE